MRHLYPLVSLFMLGIQIKHVFTQTCTIFNVNTTNVEENKDTAIEFNITNIYCVYTDIIIYVSRYHDRSKTYSHRCTIHLQPGATCRSNVSLCGCADQKGRYWFRIKLQRSDKERWKLSTYPQVVADKLLHFTILYLSRVMQLTVDGNEGSEHILEINKTAMIKCHWRNGYPTSEARLIDNKANIFRTTQKDSDVLFHEIRFSHCQEEIVIRCESGMSDNNITTHLRMKCREQDIKYTENYYDSETDGKDTTTSIVRRRSVTSPYQTTTPPRTESDKSSSKTSSYNEVDDLELTARIREEAESVEYTRPSPPTAHAHSTRSHAERLTAVPPEAVTIEQAARAQQPEYVEIENEVRPNGDDGYLVPAGQYASLNPATRSEEGHEYENLGSKPTEPSSTPGYSGLVKSTKREKHLYDRLKRETNQTVEAEEDEPAYAIALEQMPGPTFTKL